MDVSTMQTARESFLKNHYLNESSLQVLNDAEDLSSLLIKVEAFDSIEKGVFFYNAENNEFSLYQAEPFFVRTRRPCSSTGECYKNVYDTCVLRYAGESTHSFERFLQLCLEGFYELIEIFKK